MYGDWLQADEMGRGRGVEMNSRRAMSPGKWVGCLALFQLIVLVTIPYAFSSAPPLDVVEGLVWAPHWLLGTYKHPPLPSWLIEMSVLITRDVILGPYLLSQFCVALTYFFIYRLGRLVLDPIRAAAGTILMAGTYYFTVPTLEFNHNVIQLPLWSGALLVFGHVRRQPDRWIYWLILGALSGLGLYGKYTFALLLIVLLIVALYEHLTRRAFATAKPYGAALIGLVVFLPHLIWLFRNQFEPLNYAMERSGGATTSNPIWFLLAQLADHLPILFILAVVGYRGLIRAETAITPLNDRNFLRLIAFGPLLLTLVLFVVSGSSGKDMWGMPMFTPLGLCLVAEFGRRWSMPHLGRAALAAMALIGLVGTGFIVQSLYPYGRIAPRSNWPMQELAGKVDEAWKGHSNQPLGFIGGAPFAAGLVAIGLDSRSQVVIGSDLTHSPWVSEEQIAKRGIVFVLQQDQAPPALCSEGAYKSKILLSDPLIPPLWAIVCPPKRTD